MSKKIIQMIYVNIIHDIKKNNDTEKLLIITHSSLLPIHCSLRRFEYVLNTDSAIANEAFHAKSIGSYFLIFFFRLLCDRRHNYWIPIFRFYLKIILVTITKSYPFF